MQASPAKNETRLPRQILRRSEAIQARLDAAKDEPKTDPVDPNAPPAQPNAPATPPVDPNPPAQPAAAAADPREQDPAYWKQRFKVVEGRLRVREEEHRAETDGLHQQISEMAEQIRALQDSAPQQINLSDYLTPKQIELLGDEEALAIVEATLKVAKAQLKSLDVSKIKPQPEAPTRQQEGENEEMRKCLEKLTELVPDWREIDNDKDFDYWLDIADESIGGTPRDLVTMHLRKHNATGLATVFKKYKASLPKAPVPPVAPNGSGAGPSGSPQAGHPTAARLRPSADDIKDFYKRKATIRKGQPGYVTDQEALEFEKRLKPGAR